MVELSNVDIQELVRLGRDTSPSGCDCYYVKINDSFGLKVIRYDDYCDFNEQAKVLYELHELAHRIGIGPKVWGLTKCGDDMCFFVEHAEVVDWTEICMEDGMELYLDVVTRAAECGYYLYDFHDENIAILNGKAVLIDGGCLSGGDYSIGRLELPEEQDADYLFIERVIDSWKDDCNNWNLMRYCKDYE